MKPCKFHQLINGLVEPLKKKKTDGLVGRKTNKDKLGAFISVFKEAGMSHVSPKISCWISFRLKWNRMALSPVISIVDRSRSQFKSLINEIFDGGGAWQTKIYNTDRLCCWRMEMGNIEGHRNNINIILN